MCTKSCGKCTSQRGGQWGSWGRYGQCNKSCGRGKRYRVRKCYRGNCAGHSREYLWCNTHSCPSQSSPSAPTCGRRLDNPLIRGRIVGGVNAREGAWPWQVGLFKSANDKFPFCGGTIISNRVVLTAAHCFPTLPTTVYVRVGDHDLNKNGANEKVIRVSRIIKNPAYNSKTMQSDLTLLVLSKSLRFGPGVNAACLPKPTDRIRSTCTITGWGKLAEGGRQPTILQEAKVPFVDRKTCNKAYKGKILLGMICGGVPQGGTDSCQGDSGGPFVCQNRRNGRYILFGVTSWGFGCARKGYYGVYADVMDRGYKRWIEASMKPYI